MDLTETDIDNNIKYVFFGLGKVIIIYKEENIIENLGLLENSYNNLKRYYNNLKKIEIKENEPIEILKKLFQKTIEIIEYGTYQQRNLFMDVMNNIKNYIQIIQNKKVEILLIKGFSNYKGFAYLEDIKESYKSLCNYTEFINPKDLNFQDLIGDTGLYNSAFKNDGIKALIIQIKSILEDCDELIIFAHSYGGAILARALESIARNSPEYIPIFKQKIYVQTFGTIYLISEKTEFYELAYAINYFNSNEWEIIKKVYNYPQYVKFLKQPITSFNRLPSNKEQILKYGKILTRIYLTLTTKSHNEYDIIEKSQESCLVTKFNIKDSRKSIYSSEDDYIFLKNIIDSVENILIQYIQVLKEKLLQELKTKPDIMKQSYIFFRLNTINNNVTQIEKILTKENITGSDLSGALINPNDDIYKTFKYLIKLLLTASKEIDLHQVYKLNSDKVLSLTKKIIKYNYIIDESLDSIYKISRFLKGELKNSKETQFKDLDNKLNILVLTGVGTYKENVDELQEEINSEKIYSSSCNFDIFNYDSKGIFYDIMGFVGDKLKFKSDRVKRVLVLLEKYLVTDKELVIVCWSHGALLTYNAIMLFIKQYPERKDYLKKVTIYSYGAAHLIPVKSSDYELKDAINYFNSTDWISYVNRKVSKELLKNNPYNVLFTKIDKLKTYNLFVYKTTDNDDHYYYLIEILKGICMKKTNLGFSTPYQNSRSKLNTND